MSVEMKLDVPDREPGEKPATEAQKDYIRHLGQISEADIRTLGKWQASSLIDQMKYIKESGIIEQTEYNKKRKKRGCSTLFVIALFLLCIWVFNPFRSSPQSDKVPADKAAQSQPLENPEQGGIAKESHPITTLENLTLPVVLVSTEEFSLLDNTGKQTTIPVGSIITVESRGKGGTLTTRINGNVFVGSEERLAGKAKEKMD